MGCGCHSSRAAQPVRQAARRTTRISVSEPIVRNVYNTGSAIRKKIIRRTISH